MENNYDEKKDDGKPHRAFVFTINNWTEELLCSCLEVLDKARYSIIGFEIAPTTGTKHIQGYVYFKNGILFKTFCKRMKHGRCEIARGTAEQNRVYCSKDGEYNEFGTMPMQGSRTDLQHFKDDILDGHNQDSLLENHTDSFAHFDRFYQRCRNIHLKKIAQEINTPEIIVLIGEPGCGKTRHIYDTEKLEDIYKLEVGDGSSGSLFWNGYDGEPVILIDDFHNNIKLDYMLRLLDRYPMQLNTKGGYTWKCAKKIYITSNIDINNWYPNCPDIHKRALRRRITEIKYLQQELAQSTPHIESLLC